jgi:hypothetical protein
MEDLRLQVVHESGTECVVQAAAEDSCNRPSSALGFTVTIERLEQISSKLRILRTSTASKIANTNYNDIKCICTDSQDIDSRSDYKGRENLKENEGCDVSDKPAGYIST